MVKMKQLLVILVLVSLSISFIPGSVYALTGDMNGTISLQGRPAPPDASWITDLTAYFYQSDALIYTVPDIDTDNEGAFTVSGIDYGTYDVAIKCPRSLSSIVTGVVISGTPIGADFGTLQEGDSNDDDAITYGDYTLYLSYFGETSQEALDACDFNRDGAITGMDYSLLWLNWHITGDLMSTTLVAEVDLQGRPARPNAAWITPLTVYIFESGTSTVLDTAYPDTDNEGLFMVTDIYTGGAVDIGIKCPRSLSELLAGITFPYNEVIPFPILREGDCNDDDAVTDADYSILWYYFGQSSQEACDAADFNRDGVVNGADYALLWFNISQVGDLFIMPTQTLTIRPNGDGYATTLYTYPPGTINHYTLVDDVISDEDITYVTNDSGE